MHQPDTHAAVTKAMASIQAHDACGVESLFDLAFMPVRRIIQHEIRSSGVHLSNDQLEDLTRDAIVDLAGLAGVWRPDGGALPWTWARKRIVANAFRSLMGCCDELDEEKVASSETGLVLVPPTETADLSETLVSLAETHPEANLLLEALLVVASERDRRVYLDYVVEQATGNPAASGAVAMIHGLGQANVRKIVERVRRRLSQLASEEPGYAGLADLHLVAA